MQEVKAVFIHQQLVTAAESVYFDGQVERGTRQFQFAFFDAAHIQNVIDQRQQM